MKEKMQKFFTLTLAACMMFSFAACNQGFVDDNKNNNNQATKGEYSYLAIDINPSIELVVKDLIVVEVKACNEDAAVLLSGEDFSGMTVEEVSQSIVELAEDLGYLTEENYDVKITVSADSEESIQSIVKWASQGAQKGSDLAKINNAPRSADERKVKELQAEDAMKYKDLTPAKLRLIEAIMKYDEEMTYEIGATLKVSELADMLEDYAKAYGDIVGEELEALFEQAWKNLKNLAKDKIAEYYGEEYQAAWERYVALEKVAREIEHKAKNIPISEEDMLAIIALLESQKEQMTPSDMPQAPNMNENPNANETSKDVNDDTQTKEPAQEDDKDMEFGYDGGFGNKDDMHGEANKHGDWRVEDYDDYFDRHHHDKWNDDKFEEIEEQIEAILEKYDEDAYLLTEDDLAAIALAWGEALELETFEDLEDFLDEEKEKLEELRREAEETLRMEDKITIEIMEEASKQWKKKAHNEIKEQIEKLQEEWKALKEEKKGKR
ncbi:MAG: hypothetical protein E7349_03925 [Clostridiales bacterium]|nr:hypothetical protein [Clostridiales bacterium]